MYATGCHSRSVVHRFFLQIHPASLCGTSFGFVAIRDQNRACFGISTDPVPMPQRPCVDPAAANSMVHSGRRARRSWANRWPPFNSRQAPVSRRKFCKREKKTLRVFPIFVDSRIQKTAIASKLPKRQTAVQKMSQQLLLSILSRLIWCEGNPDKRKEQMQVAP